MWAASSQYIGFAVQFLASVLIARYFLGPAEVGLFSVAFSAAALVHGLQDFGLSRYVIGAREMDEGQVRKAFSVSVLVAVCITGVILLMAGPVTALYGNDGLYPILLVLGVSYIFIPFSVVPLALMQRRMDFRGFAIVDVGAHLCNFAVSITAAWYGFSSLALAFGVFGYQFTRAFLTQCLNPIFSAWPPSLRGTLPMLRYGMSSSFLSLSGTVGESGPELIIGKAINEAALGLYGRATGLALQIRLLVGGPIASVFYPSLARARDAGEDLGDHYIRLTAALCAVTWAAMAGLAVAAEPLILAIYGERWAEVAPILAWIALAQIFFIAIPMQIEVAYLFGSWKRVIQLTVIETILSLALLILAVPYGLLWVAASRVLHGMIWWSIHAIFIQRLVRFRWRDLFMVYAKTAIASLAAVVPLLSAYTWWMPAADMSFGVLVMLSGVGVGAWYLALCAVNHPSAADLTGMARQQFGKLRDLYRPSRA